MKRLFTTKPIHSYQVGGGAFKMDFYVNERVIRDNYLHITTPSLQFELKVRGFAYGFLLAAYKQKRYKELEAFCYVMYRISDGVYRDEKFAEDIIKALTKYDKRMLAAAKKSAKDVTEAEEMANQALMEEVAEYADADKKKRKELKKGWRKRVEDALAEE